MSSASRPLTAQDFARVEAIFAEAAELTGEARLRALDTADDRPDLRREVETLLAAHDHLARSDPADEDAGTARHRRGHADRRLSSRREGRRRRDG